MADVFVPIFLFASIFGVVYIMVSASHKEKMAQIEKGIFLPVQKSKRNPLYLIKFGLLFIGISVGVLVGNILVISTILREGVAFWTSICFFGGISLIAAYLIEKKILKKDE